MAEIVIPECEFVGIVISAGKLTLRPLTRPLPNPSYEYITKGKHFYAHGDAYRHKGFRAMCDAISEKIGPCPLDLSKQRKNDGGLEYCHYHKARVGHNIDNCPNVRCRICQAAGHTDRMCNAEVCQVCGKYGHVAEKCWHRACDECGNKGHVSTECFSKMACETCGKTGHPTEKCFGVKVAAPVWCAYHQSEGDHPSSQCPDLKDWKCENCGEKGHFFKNCHNPNIVRTRRRVTPEDTREFIYVGGGAPKK